MLPGSIRSGENARKKSSPAFIPPRSRIGATISSVAPGYTVLSRITVWPRTRMSATCSVADTTNETSGSWLLPSGVGTQMLIAVASRSSPKSVVAWKRPESVAIFRSIDGTSPMYDSPFCSERILRPSTSTPTTGISARQNSMASGSPT